MIRFVRPAILLTFAVSSLAFGQISEIDLEKPLGEQVFPVVRPQPGETIALEQPVDPSEYRLGPGDKLEFGVWGGIEIHSILTVGPDGGIIVPSVGMFFVADKTVTDAERLLQQAALKRYEGSQISLRLILIRTMKVTVSGSVVFPGVFDVSAVDRLSTLINLAGGFVEPPDQDDDYYKKVWDLRLRRKLRKGTINDWIDKDKDLLALRTPDILPSLRHIEIEDRKGEKRSVDYLRFKRAGDIEFNPILQNGDRVHVPVLGEKVGVLHIFGAVKSPGEYEYRNDDHLLDLVRIAGGFRKDADLSTVTIVRYDKENLVSIELYCDLGNLAEDDRGTKLQVEDRVFIRSIPRYSKKYYVTVSGEVVRPGVYPIVPDSTKLSDIVNSCGGFTERADMTRSRLIRWELYSVEDPDFWRLSQQERSDMSRDEFLYFKELSRFLLPEVVVDFDRLFNSDDADQDAILHHLDEIEIPIRNLTVSVIGQIKSPGLVPYVPGADLEYYINKAGGYSLSANEKRTRQKKTSSGLWIKVSRKSVFDIGDTIFVPEKEELRYWDVFKDVLLVVSQVTTVLLVVQFLR